MNVLQNQINQLQNQISSLPEGSSATVDLSRFDSKLEAIEKQNLNVIDSKADVDFEDGEKKALGFELPVNDAVLPEQVGSAYLKPGQVTAVVNDAHHVGFRIPDDDLCLRLDHAGEEVRRLHGRNSICRVGVCRRCVVLAGIGMFGGMMPSVRIAIGFGLCGPGALDDVFDGAYDLLHGVGLSLQLLGGGGGFLGSGGVVLHLLVHGGNGGVDLAKAVGLLLAGLGDLFDEFSDVLSGGADFVKGEVGVFDEGAAFGDFFDGVVDEGGGIFGGFGGALGECADFPGHDCKSGSGFAGACGFDGRVEGEEIGLEGDLVDGFDDALGVLAGLGDRFDRFVEALHELAGVREFIA
jgi:hypothetical protein